MERILTALLVVACSPLLRAQTPTPEKMTRQQAEQIALANNPRIQASQLLAKVQGQVVRERRADALPNLTGSITGVETNGASRISAGTITAPRIVSHAGVGIGVSQLITDFGHTNNLITSEKLKEKARQADALASREDIVVAADQAFYAAIEARATVEVADETVSARQALVDKVSALAAAKLKSSLDLSFAQVDLSQAKLLQLDTRNNFDAAKAALNAVLGYDKQTDYDLVEDNGEPPALPPDPDAITATALENRPDLQSLRFSEQAAQSFSRAQHAQLFPTISAEGMVGYAPAGSSLYFTPDWYGAAGVNIGIPIFEGFRLRAQAAEASLLARTAAENTRDLKDKVVRDVRTAWLNAKNAQEKVTVSKQLLDETNTALDLAQTRYQLGLSSIVELSQAQLQQTEAAIGNANAKAQYSFAIANLQYQMGSNSH